MTTKIRKINMSEPHKFLESKEEIEDWLLSHEIDNYTIVPNPKITPDNSSPWIVNVRESINLERCDLSFFPVQFGRVNGCFEFRYNKLTSLKGCPQILGGDFCCDDNELISLQYSPKITASFTCENNNLTSLKFCPKIVEGVFSCSNNDIENLDFLPDVVGDNFYCDRNPKLGSLQDNTDFEDIQRLQLEIEKVQMEKTSLEEGLKQKIETEKSSKLFKV